MSVLPTLVGLSVALGGVAWLASPASRRLGHPDRLATKLREQLVLWALFAAVLAIVVGWERAPLASLGLRPPDWRSLAWAAVLTLFVMRVAAPAGAWAAARAGLSTFEAGIADFGRWPLRYRVFAVVTAGVVEETLFRGYALERIAALSGSRALAGVVTLAIFVAVHGPFWGRGALLAMAFPAAAFTAFFAWRPDLLANVVAHVAVDAMGLLVAPARAKRRAGTG